MIQFSNVSKRYRETGRETLSNISFNIDRGGMAFLTGNSGAGKTTLLKLIALITKPTRGDVFVDGANLGTLRHSRIPALRRKIGLIYQDFQLLNDRTVFENVALPLKISGLHPQDIGRRTRAALDKVGLLRKERAMPLTLSGGEQQRVGIARAVVNKPPILLADEPTGNLDPSLSLEIMSMFEQFNDVGVTVLVASHDYDLIQRFGKPIIHLHDGKRVDREPDLAPVETPEPEAEPPEPPQPFANPYG